MPDANTPSIGSLWRRRGGGETLNIHRVWTYFGVLTVRGHPTHGGRPLVAPVSYLHEHYEEVA